MARPFESFAKGVSLGLDLSAAYGRTRELIDDRAMRAKAEQVAQESAAAMKQINAPVDVARQMAMTYAEEVMADPSKRDPAKEHTLMVASAQAQMGAVMNRLDYGMNVIASNPGNKYVEAAMKPTVDASLQQMENFRLQMAQQENTRQAEAERVHETSERDAMETHQASMELTRQQGGYEREEQAQGNRLEYLGEQDRLIRERAEAGIGEKGKKTAMKFLDDLDFAESRANDAAGEIPEEEWAALAEEQGVEVDTYQAAWKKAKARRELRAAGYPEEKLNTVFGQEGQEGQEQLEGGEEGAKTGKPGEALLGRIGELLESKNLNEKQKAALRKKQEAVLAQSLAVEGSQDMEDAEKILGLGYQIEQLPEAQSPSGPPEDWEFLGKYFKGYDAASEDERRQSRFKLRQKLGGGEVVGANVPYAR